MENRFEKIRIRLEGCHYQPDGHNEAYVVGISWDKKYEKPCIHLLYPNGKEDFIPLEELSQSHPLGSTTILNCKELKNG